MQAALEQEQQRGGKHAQKFETKMSTFAEHLAGSQRERGTLQAALGKEGQTGKAASEEQERVLKACQTELQACKTGLAAAHFEKSAGQSALEASKQACRAAAGELRACQQQLAAADQENSALQTSLRGEQQETEELEGKLCACQEQLRSCTAKLDAVREDKRTLEAALVAEVQLGSCGETVPGQQQDARVGKFQAACCALGTELEARMASNDALCAMLQTSGELNVRLQAQICNGLQALMKAMAAAQDKSAVGAHALGSCSLPNKLAVMAFTLQLILGARNAAAKDT